MECIRRKRMNGMHTQKSMTGGWGYYVGIELIQFGAVLAIKDGRVGD
jgi:hypothetical protein